MNTFTIPVTIAPDVTAYVADLGLEQPFQQMLAHIQQEVLGLRAIAVSVQPPYDLGGDPCVILDVTTQTPPPDNDQTEQDFVRWQVENFAPEVYQYFTMLLTYG
jgi:hypothetical protein